MARRRKKTSDCKGSRQGNNRDSKRFRSERDVAENSKEYSSDNDPAWYSKDPALLRDAASIPFTWPVGVPLKLSDSNIFQQLTASKDVVSIPGYLRIPGIMAFKLRPSVGLSKSPTSAINVASQAYYAILRGANSGAKNYDSVDSMMITIAMAEVYSYIVFLQRCYGLANLYSAVNQYIPKAMLKLCNVDFSSILQNLANFRYGINVLINKAASLAVPADKSYFERKAFLYRDIYTEGTSFKDQMYLYVPDEFYFYTYDEESKLGYLHPSSAPGSDKNPATVDDLLAYGESLMNALFRGQDAALISGDVLKAYGSNIIKLAEMPEQYIITPIFNIGVLEQMKNATVVGKYASGGDITQNILDDTAPYLVAQPMFDNNNFQDALTPIRMFNMLKEKKVLTTTTGEVTPELVIESSRLMVSATAVNAKEQTGAFHVTAELVTGTEIVSGIKIAKIQEDVNQQSTKAPTPNVITVVDGLDYIPTQLRNSGGTLSWAQTQFTEVIKQLVLMNNFRFHPASHLFYTAFNSTDQYPLYDLGLFLDIDNFAVLDTEELERLHDTALISLFYSPLIAKLR